MTHICVGYLTVIGSDNGLSHGRRQAMIWTNAGILFIGPLGTNSREMFIEILAFSIQENVLESVVCEMASILSRPQCVNRFGSVPVNKSGEFWNSWYSHNKIKHNKAVYLYQDKSCTLQWRHNGGDSVSNHQPYDCLLRRLFRRRSKQTSKLRVTGLCAGNSPGPVNFPHKWPVTRKMFPFDDIIMISNKHKAWDAKDMMRQQRGNAFHITAHLWEEFTFDGWIPFTKAQ